MKLVIDANILFASLVKDRLTAKLLLSDKLNWFAPEFLFDEFLKYEEYILKKTDRSKEDLKNLDKKIVQFHPESIRMKSNGILLKII